MCIVLFLIGMDAANAGRLMDAISGSPKASGFSLDSTDGSTVSLDDFKGKFVLLNFWATWCAPCREEMPSMSNLHGQLKSKGLEVVGVHVGPSLAGVKKFLNEVPVDFTILLDKDMSLSGWGVRGLPTTFLINPEGKMIYSAVGEREWDSSEMVKFISGLMDNYGRVTEAEDGQMQVKEHVKIQKLEEGHKSFFTSLKESIGWKCDTKENNFKFLPN